MKGRAWSLPHWFNGVEEACAQVGWTPAYVFVSDPRDAATQDVINGFTGATRRTLVQSWVEEESVRDVRDWNEDRYHRMVYLRNLLLDKVRELEPLMFLSLDSDIFLHPNALASLWDGMNEYDALATKVYMTPYGTETPNMGFFDQNGSFYRNDEEGFIGVDVIMAAKLMLPLAYHVDYQWHPKGEDLGWSKACKERGLKLGFDGRVTSKHAMTPDWVGEVDIRAGF